MDDAARPSDLGASLYALIERLYPICRSITGPGVRETLRILSEIHPISITEVPTGTEVFDWTVPKEWSIRDAFIKDASGARIVDFRKHNLHVLNYSVPVKGAFTLAELRPHLFSMPDRPDLIPYRTSYYNENWGFCLPHAQLETLGEGPFEVEIDSTLADGSLTLGEIVLPGEIEDEILISAHTCHPSLANDNLSGLAIAMELARRLAAGPRRHTFRFVFGPGTIGSISWLALNEARAQRIKHGLVLTGAGDGGALLYKRSRRGDTLIDRAGAHVMAARGGSAIDFYPYGYDERQYCSPGFDLAVGRISRTPHGEYREYHTSGDNLDFVQPTALAHSFDAIWDILQIVEGDRTYVSLNPKGEPRLGKRGLYRQVAGQANAAAREMAMLWILAYADGAHSLLDIAEKAKTSFTEIKAAADALAGAALLRES